MGVEADEAADRLRHPLRLVVELQHYLRPRVVQLVEGDGAIRTVLVQRLPGDSVVWVLLGDLGVPLTRLTSDLGDPVKPRVGLLLDALDAVHELRKRLELRPLVVGGRNGN